MLLAPVPAMRRRRSTPLQVSTSRYKMSLLTTDSPKGDRKAPLCRNAPYKEPLARGKVELGHDHCGCSTRPHRLCNQKLGLLRQRGPINRASRCRVMGDCSAFQRNPIPCPSLSLSPCAPFLQAPASSFHAHTILSLFCVCAVGDAAGFLQY